MTNEFINSRETSLAILENAIEGILIAEMGSKKFKYANAAICEMFGYTSKEFLTLSVREIHPPEHLRMVLEQFESLARGDIKLAPSVPCLRKDKTIFWADITSSKNTINGIECNVGFFFDITEKKKAQEQAIASLQLLSSAADNLNGILWVVDTNLRITLSRGQNLAFLGLKPDQAIGMSLYDFFKNTDGNHPSIVAHHRALQGEVVELENIRDGITFSSVFSPVKNASGDIIGVVGLAINISGAKRAEKALDEEKDRLNRIAATVPGLICSLRIRPDGTMSMPYASPASEKLYGLRPEELEQDASVISYLCHPDDQESVKESVLESARTLSPWRKEFRYKHPQKGEIWIEGHSMPQREADGSTIWHGFLTDITERKKSEETIRNIQKLESLGVLAGGIAHDFNNLLSGIFGCIDLACSVSKEPQTLQYLQTALGSIERVRALTMQLLTFAKGGAPVQKITPLIPFLKENVQFALSGSAISCTFSLEENLWPCNIDKNQIGQVLDNVIINAQQAMPNGGLIEIIAQNILLDEKEHPVLAKGSYVKVSIKDYGIGIPKEILIRIFDPFFTTKEKGHGLGLATCYSIIKRHSGSIDVESEQGKGSTFTIYLPASTESVIASTTDSTKLKYKGSGKIIVMEDEKELRLILKEMLQSLGHKVVCKCEGKETVDFYINEREKHQFSAMIFDLTIPGGMGGIEAAAEIRKLDNEIPIFVVSGYANDPVIRNPSKFGFTASICKPFTIADLSDMLQQDLK